MKKVGVKVLRGEKQQIEEELGLKKEKVYILKDEKLRTEIIQLHHNVLVVGYRRRWKTIELVTRNYWWSGVTKNVGKYVDNYNMCQRIKNYTKALMRKLIANKGTREAIDIFNG